MGTLTINFDVPWKSAYIGTEFSLDIAYQGSHSGHKTITPFVDGFLDPDKYDDVLTAQDINSICMALWATYRRKWEKLWELYTKEYDPFYNYDMQTDLTEGIQSTGTKGGTVSVNGTQTLNNTDTTTKTGTVSESGSDNTVGNVTETEGGTQTNQKTLNTTEGISESKSGSETASDEGTQTNQKTLNTVKMHDETTEYGKTETDRKTGTETDTIMDDTTVTTNVSGSTTGTKDDQLFGFNSVAAVPSDSSQSTGTNTETTTETKERRETDTKTFDTTDTKTLGGEDSTSFNESDTGTVTDVRTDDLTSSKEKSESSNSTKTETGTVTDTRTDNLTKDTDSSETTTSSSTLTNNLQEATAHTGTIGNTTTTTNNLTDTDSADRVVDEHKYGNIGVATIQRMFKEEVENWTWTFMNTVFDDIDAMLVLAVH